MPTLYGFTFRFSAMIDFPSRSEMIAAPATKISEKLEFSRTVVQGTLIYESSFSAAEIVRFLLICWFYEVHCRQTNNCHCCLGVCVCLCQFVVLKCIVHLKWRHFDRASKSQRWQLDGWTCLSSLPLLSASSQQRRGSWNSFSRIYNSKHFFFTRRNV